jgi:hypothetical protein
MQLSGWPVVVFQNRMHLSAVPPPDVSSPLCDEQVRGVTMHATQAGACSKRYGPFGAGKLLPLALIIRKSTRSFKRHIVAVNESVALSLLAGGCTVPGAETTRAP